MPRLRHSNSKRDETLSSIIAQITLTSKLFDPISSFSDLTIQGTSGGECYGTYESPSGTGYTSSCIHSGSNDYIDENTVWYNYALASANTVTGIKNTNVANESICPKGWTLPSYVQSKNNNNTTDFTPVLGGNYVNGILYNEDIRGYWWISEAYSETLRYFLYYDGSNLTIGTGGIRYDGFYIRCVSEEKDVSDLTYMQDMTPSVAANTAERTALPTILQELCVIVNVLRA
ncbi:hypothetical protein IJG93_01570 [Candidatus Saccharibacteria bacterium]|nr:hypothetical protein [Candidatus Saccharibacteria bacterium]